MKRGDIVTAVLPGDFGKARPALIVQADALMGLPSVLICPFTSDVVGIGGMRLLVDPTDLNGLKVRSELMTEKITAILWSRTRERIGALDAEIMRAIDMRLHLVLGLAGQPGSS